MKNLNITVVATAIALAFSAGAMAQTMSKDQYKSRKDGIAAEYKSAKAACTSLSGNAKDICKIETSGNDKVAKAELDAEYKPSENASYKARVARAEADYSVAREKCDDKAGNAKDICLKEARAAETSAKADAKARMKVVDANDKAARTSAKANSKANIKGAEARGEAAADKRDAEYAVAKEKCDKFAGDVKASCVEKARVRFGQS